MEAAHKPTLGGDDTFTHVWTLATTHISRTLPHAILIKSPLPHWGSLRGLSGNSSQLKLAQRSPRGLFHSDSDSLGLGLCISKNPCDVNSPVPRAPTWNSKTLGTV